MTLPPDRPPNHTPWALQPDRLWSLRDMLQEFASYFYALGGDMARKGAEIGERFRTEVAVDHIDLPNLQLTDDLMPDSEEITSENIAEVGIHRFYNEFENDTTKGLAFAAQAGNYMPLPMTMKKLVRVQEMLQAPYTWFQMEQAFSELNERFEDELRAHKFLYVRPELVSLYETETDPFGPKVSEVFPDASDDIVEAGKCLALRRSKAAVCHLMLAMEHALRKAGDKLGATLIDKNGVPIAWLGIANNLKPKIEAMAEGATKTEWWEVHSMLWAVGKAWRNPTMHPADSYSEEQARKVYDACKGFMQDLAALI